MRNLEKIIQDYKIWLEVAGRKSINYLAFNKKFWDYCEENKIFFETVTLNDLNNFLFKCKENNSNKTIATKIQGIRSFFSFLHENGIVDDKTLEIPYKLKAPKFEKKIRGFLTKKEFDMLIKYSDASDHIPYQKIRAVLTLLFYTGIRKSEFLALKRKDFDFEKAVLKITNFKSKQEKNLPILIKVAEVMKEYFSTEEEKFHAFNMSSRMFESMLIELNEWKIIEQHLTPHLFRHSFAHYMLECGMTIEDLKEMLGHTDIKTTMIYSTKTEQEVRESYLKKVK